ncbi:MAG: hypothetical protein LBT14_07590 [Treponema sp.]|jgi:uncharacterized membrane protein YvbJ|nr:hypothetical protein [Treponema sp.]
MKRSLRFFCDNCGAEVSQDTKDCPECGKVFASVRCPVCGFVGEVSLFDTGCPSCGYSAQPAADNKGATSKMKAPQKQELADSPLPVWVYVVAGLVFLGVCVALFHL